MRDDHPERRTAAPLRIIAVCLLIAATAAVYVNSISVPFLFDDTRSIAENPTISRLSDLGAVLNPPKIGSGVTGRPMVNLSLAINYAIGGLDVRGYHALNLALHIGSALLFFGVVRRTLARPPLQARFSGNAPDLVAFAAAALWALHPLQTESVTGVIQRTELLVGFFYLLTLYCFVRATTMPSSAKPTEGSERRFWFWLAMGASLLGMASKEVMVTAPVMVFLYDRTFVSGSFRDSWRRHWRIHTGLAATWILLVLLVASVGGTRGSGAGFGLGITPFSYLLKQCEAIVHYLRLVLWPVPLVLDYGTDVITDPAKVWWQGLLLVTGVVATLVALRRRPVLGFLGAWFFVVLAPSSSFVPLVTQTMAEHRMYLPLAPLAALVAGTAWIYLGKRGTNAAFVVAIGLGAGTVARNAVYSSPIWIWEDTVAKRPQNARAHYNLGCVLANVPERRADMIEQYEAAIQLDPAYAEAHNNLGNALVDIPGREADAIAHFEAALKIRPEYADAHNNLGNMLAASGPGRTGEAVLHFELAAKQEPGFAEARFNLANVLAATGRGADAIAQYEAALRIRPNYPDALNNLAIAYARAGRVDDALKSIERAAAISPGDAEIRKNLDLFRQMRK